MKRKYLFIFILVFFYSFKSLATLQQHAQGRAAYQKGDFNEASKFFKASCDFFIKNQGESHNNTLICLSDLATVTNDLGDADKAIELFEKIVSLRIKYFGMENTQTLTAMNNLAIAYNGLGKYSEALNLLEKAIKAQSTIDGIDSADALFFLQNLSETYRLIGKYSEALNLNTDILAKQIKLLGEKNIDTLLTLSNRAAIFSSIGRTEDELKLNQKVLALRIELQGERHPNTILVMNNLAITYSKLNRINEAAELFEKVLDFQNKTVGENHPYAMKTMGALAMAYMNLGRYTDSLKISNKALLLQSLKYGDSHVDTATTLYNLTLINIRMGNKSEAQILGKRFINAVEVLRDSPQLSLENRQLLFSQYAEAYREFSIFNAQNGSVYFGFNLAELSKSRTLLESVSGQTAIRSGTLPKSETNKLETINKQISDKTIFLEQTRSPQVRQTIESEINQLTREFNSLNNELKKTYPKFAYQNEINLISDTNLDSISLPNTMFLDYLVRKNKVDLFTVDYLGKIQYFDLGEIPFLNEVIEGFRRSISNERGVKGVEEDDDKLFIQLTSGNYRLLKKSEEIPENSKIVLNLKEVSSYLNRKLLPSMFNNLINVNRLIISPDGPLSQLPFEVLSENNSETKLIEKFDVQYTQSLSVFSLGLKLKQTYSKLTDRKELLAFGNPEYQIQSTKAEKRTLINNINTRSVRQLQDLDARWINLPGTEKEVNLVASQFPKKSTVFLGSLASEKNLQNLNSEGELKNYKYLLFSTHGYLSPDSPSLSSIVLSLINKSPNTDGYITASEWPNYDLRSDLIVLSACETGLGNTISGEGVMGLPYALFVAGNINTLLTLWPVDDDATAEFINVFFKNIKSGFSYYKSLSLTKKYFLKHKNFSNSRFWAAFVLIGPG